MIADVWEKDVWEFQVKSGSSGSCRLFLHFLGKIADQEMSGKTPRSPRHPCSRHPRPSEKFFWGFTIVGVCLRLLAFVHASLRLASPVRGPEKKRFVFNL